MGKVIKYKYNTRIKLNEDIKHSFIAALVKNHHAEDIDARYHRVIICKVPWNERDKIRTLSWVSSVEHG